MMLIIAKKYSIRGIAAQRYPNGGFGAIFHLS